MGEKQKIYLTDIQMHTRGFRPTGSYEKASNSTRRIYSPVPKGYEKNIDREAGRFTFQIDLPPDLLAKLESGEAELVFPKGGIPIFAGKDMAELIQKHKRKEHRRELHRNPTRVWHADDNK
jgi:hypothetical protein